MMDGKKSPLADNMQFLGASMNVYRGISPESCYVFLMQSCIDKVCKPGHLPSLALVAD